MIKIKKKIKGLHSERTSGITSLMTIDSFVKIDPYAGLCCLFVHQNNNKACQLGLEVKRLFLGWI